MIHDPALHGATERMVIDPLLAHRQLDTRVARAQSLARGHYAMLDAAEAATDDRMALCRIATMRARVRQYAAWDDAGMLGENGIAPGVRDVCGLPLLAVHP